MSVLSFFGFRRRVVRVGLTAVATVATALAWTAVLSWSDAATWAQGVDCERLRAMLSQPDRSGGAGAKARQQASELARTRAYAHQLGCDSKGFLFFGGGGDNPQCPGLNARISQMEANLGRLQGGGGRNDLLARYNASCRGGQPRERGFFESIFGGPDTAPPPSDVPPDEPAEPDDGGARGGSQAVCVRTCDGGFFPLPISSHHNADSLTQLCSALCPGTESAVYTRGPNSEIKTALSLDGKPYMDMPNALKFQKAYAPTCSCRPAGKTWAEALANAEGVLGNQRKGDILVTPEKSEEMSRPKLSPEIRGALIEGPGTTKVSPEEASKLTANAQSTNAPSASAPVTVTGPDGVKRLVRRVGPQP